MNLRLLILLCALWLPLTHTAGAASNYIVRAAASAGRFFFNPTNITIAAGDSITWTNTHTQAHDSTAGVPDSSPPFLWSSGDMTSGGPAFVFTLTNAGYFPYRCKLHADGGVALPHPEQTGAVLVVSANLPPTVGITNPGNNSTFTAPATYTLMAGVTDDVAVVSVEFFRSGLSLGTDNTAPFEFALAGVVASTNLYTAVATDGGGLKGTSAVVSIVVTNLNLPPSVSLTNPAGGAAFAAPASFTLKVNATDDVAVVSVQYFNNGSLFSTAGPAPFDLAVSNLTAGNYSFTAVAIDGGGLSATSAPPVTIFALTNAVLTNFQRLPNGFTQFDVLGIADQTYLIDAADALTNWTVIGTNVAPAGSFTFVDTNATSLIQRIYRARQLPTP